MPRLQKGDPAPDIILPAIDGQTYHLKERLVRPVMISFMRFATCPFCNMRVHELITNYPATEGELDIVLIFESPIEHLTKHVSSHKAPFPILADSDKKYYRAYGIEKSIKGLLTGMVTRFPTLIRGLFRGHLPIPVKGSMIRMPADFVVDKNGIIQMAYYGRDEGDHLSLHDLMKLQAHMHYHH